jgi:pimeloyl-ACP methyl ester carboxylesterase
MLVLGSGKPLLFLHGDVPSDAFISELARGFRVIAPFHPGFGSKDRPKNIRDVSDLAYLYLDLIEEHELTSLVLVGASFGGWIAAEVAIRNSTSLSHLILSAPLGIKVRGRDQRDIEDIFAMTDGEYASVAFADQSKARWLADDPSDEELASHFRCLGQNLIASSMVSKKIVQRGMKTPIVLSTKIPCAIWLASRGLGALARRDDRQCRVKIHQGSLVDRRDRTAELLL